MLLKNGFPFSQMLQISEAAARCIEVDQRASIVFVNYPHPTYLSGILNVKAIRGTIQILGYNLTPDKPPVPVCSVKEFNTLKVTPIDDAQVGNDLSYLESLNIPRKKFDRLVAASKCYSHFFIVSKNEESDYSVPFLKNFDFSPFIRTDIDDPLVRLTKTDDANILSECSEWDELAAKFLRKASKILICGGKGVGKSTLLRYLINRHLEQWNKLLVVDFDPGQSEFTVMGCLSAVFIDKPLLGPNFSHITTPAKSVYLGDISVNTCPGVYSEGVEKLIEFCNSPGNKDVPLIVNTMGFVKGLGITLLVQIMNGVRPSDVIQIISPNVKDNFYLDSSSEFLNLQNLSQNEERWNPHLHVLSSVAEKNESNNGVNAAVRRNIMTMSYFRKAMRSIDADLSSTVPKKINITRVQIVIDKPTSKEIEMTMTTSQKLCCINANLVALCSQEIDCLGFGIVRGFDVETDYLYLITPLPEEALRRVVVIKMSSSVQLPQAFYKNHVDRSNGSYPYMNYKKFADKLNQPMRKTSSRLRYVCDDQSTSFD